MTLPLLISVPHAGLRVPAEAAPYCRLDPAEIAADGDEGAAAIYGGLSSRTRAFITSEVARAIVDLNRAADDRSRDGVVKTHTCWEVPVYAPFPPDAVVEQLLERWYRPYHRRLTRLAAGAAVGVDCHTMAAVAPPVAAEPGRERPAVCLSHAGFTCPDAWIEALAEEFRRRLPDERVTLNDPFTGGYIVRTHAAELPWLQLELSRGPFLTVEEKAALVLEALEAWCAQMGFV